MSDTASKDNVKLLSIDELAERWDNKVAKRTIENWRFKKPPMGPSFVYLGGRVFYTLEAVIEYERITGFKTKWN